MTKRRKPQLSAQQRVKQAAQLRQQRPLSAAERRSELGAKKALGHMSAAEHGVLVAVADAAEKYADTGPTPETRVKGGKQHPYDRLVSRGTITGEQAYSMQQIYAMDQRIKAGLGIKTSSLSRIDGTPAQDEQEEAAFWADLWKRYKDWFSWIRRRSRTSRIGCIPETINRIMEGWTLTQCARKAKIDRGVLVVLLREALDGF